MTSLRRLAACAAFASAATVAVAAQNQLVPLIEGPTYVMTYVEVTPSATAQAVAILKDYRDGSRKELGANSVDVYQEDGQSHRFVLGEIWQNRGAADAHGKAAATTGLFGKLKTIELGPPDVRIHQAQSATPPKAPNANDIVIISHIDVAGGTMQGLLGLLGPLGDASRKENGMVRYEILDEVPAHPNHFRFLEEWASMAAFEAHNRAPHTQTYRQTVLPMLGTPYDQRVYKVVN